MEIFQIPLEMKAKKGKSVIFKHSPPLYRALLVLVTLAAEPWKQWPRRMLRHKATIQAGRYAFGISGIVDPDEAERIKDAASGEREISPAPASNEKPVYTQEQFNENANKWANAISAGRATPEKIIAMVSSKYDLPKQIREQIETIVDVAEEA